MQVIDEFQQLSFDSDGNSEQIAEKRRQLYSLGVEILSDSEVRTSHPEAVSLLNRQSEGTYLSSEYSPMVSTPSSDVNRWYSFWARNVSYNGQYYDVQRLVACPINADSGLYTNGARTVSLKSKWKSAAAKLVTSTLSAVVGSVLAPPVATAYTIYEVFSSAMEELKPETNLDINDVYYRWKTWTTATFSYVRLSNQSDEFQQMSLISTTCRTEMYYTMEVNAIDTNGTGNYSGFSKTVQSSNTIYSSPNAGNIITRSIWAYTSVIGGPYYDSVKSIKLSAPNSSAVTTIYPAYPSFPIHCE